MQASASLCRRVRVYAGECESMQASASLCRLGMLCKCSASANAGECESFSGRVLSLGMLSVLKYPFSGQLRICRLLFYFRHDVNCFGTLGFPKRL